MPEISGFTWDSATRPAGSGTILEVGEGKTYATVQEAYDASSDGDTIMVYEGTYTFAGNEYYPNGDHSEPILIQHDIQIIGVGNVVFDGGWVQKGMLVTEGNPDLHLYIENITFANAWNPDNNGVGIRLQSGDLTVVDCTFVSNHGGIMANDQSGTVHVYNTVFQDTGSDGYSHPLYIMGEKLIVENCEFYGSVSGHDIKSIAGETIIVNNIVDGSNSSASYPIDITAGGDVLIDGNTVTKGEFAENGTLFYYDMNRNGGEPGTVIVQNNIFDGSAYPNPDSMELIWNRTDSVIQFSNNIITGLLEDRIIIGLGNMTGNTLDGNLLADIAYNEGALTHTAGDDVVVLEASGSTVPQEGGDGNDAMVGYVGSDTFFGDGGNDLLVGDKGDDALLGGANDDTVFGGEGADMLSGGDGNDLLDGGIGKDRLYAGAGDDTLVGGGDADIMSGGDGNDLVIGGDSAGDDVVGNAGNDILFGGAGGDDLKGGSGTDIAVFRGVFDPNDQSQSDFEVYLQWGEWRIKGITEAGMVEVGNGLNYWEGEIFYDDVESLRNIELLQFDNGVFDITTQTFTEGQMLVDINQILSNLPTSPVSSEPILGTNGDDVFTVEAFNSFTTYIGGDGYDVAVAAEADIPIRLGSLVAGDLEEISSGGFSGVRIVGSGIDNSIDLSGTVLTGITQIDAGFGNDWISGSAAGETIIGSYGDDTLLGNDGDDVFAVGLGHGIDLIQGGAGDDQILVQANDAVLGLSNKDFSASDVETISAAGYTGVSISVSGGANSWDLSDVTLTDIGEIRFRDGNDTVTGSAGGDNLNGGDGDDIIDGGLGNDTITGEAGVDLMSGGDGDDVFLIGIDHGADRFDGGAGIDVIRAVEDGTRITLASSASTYGLVVPITNVEFIDGGGFSNVVLAGNDSANYNYRDTIDLSGITLTDISLIDLGEGHDSLIGSAGDDVIRGGGGTDIISGGDGNDTFLVGVGDGHDRYDGGAGIDVIQATADGTVIGLYADATNFGTGSPVQNVEQIDGAGYADVVLQGNNSASSNLFDRIDLTGVTLTGLSLIDLGEGHDSLIGSAGDDVIRGGGGTDIISGGDGNDTFLVGIGDGSDRYDGGAGVDVIRATADGTVIGLASDGTIFGPGSPVQNIEQIDGAGYSDVVIRGNDVYNFNLFDRIDLSGVTLTGIARIELGAGNDTLVGTAGDDVIVGGADGDILSGGDGNDTFLVGIGDGSDRYDGGEGFDVIRATANGTVIGLASDGTNFGTGSPVQNIEQIDGAGYSDVVIRGNDVYNFNLFDRIDLSGVTVTGIARIELGAGNDTLVGTEGGDVIEGGKDADLLTGNGGADTYMFGLSWGSDTITDIGSDDVLDFTEAGLNLADVTFSQSGSNLIIADASGNKVTLTDGANAGIGASNFVFADGVPTSLPPITIKGTWQHNLLTGSGLDDIILGGSGHDSMYGQEGDDTLIGEDGDDKMFGGDGDDVFFVDNKDGFDTFDGGLGYDVIAASVDNAVVGVNQLLDGSSGIEEITADGHSGVVIRGTWRGDVMDFSTITLTGITEIDGGTGADRIIGSTGDDTIRGGDKWDTLSGGDGDDVFLVDTNDAYDIFMGDNGYDVVAADVDGAVIALVTNFGAENSIEEFTANGYSGVIVQGYYYNNNWDFSGMTMTGIAEIFGADGHDTIVGTAGDDNIRGGNKNDVMTGGAGNDVFLFSTGDDADQITDFEDGIDLLDLSATGLQFADITVSTSGSNTLIQYGADSILLLGIDPSTIAADDFVF